MSAAGMPSGFYDQPSDFQSFLEQDIAPQEVQQRVKDAQDFVNSVPAQVKQQFAQWYTTGDMVAFALDPQRATTAIERAYSAANVAGRAAGYGMSIDKATAEQIGGQGLTNDQIAQGVSNIALEASTAQKLAQMQGTTLTAVTSRQRRSSAMPMLRRSARISPRQSAPALAPPRVLDLPRSAAV